MTVGKLGMRKYLAGAIAILVLAFTSLGLGASSASTADTGRSVASGVASSASGDCSKAEATTVVKRLRLGEADYMPNPVFDVVCGSFMGPGSKTMVVSLASGGTSVPFEGWAVFRLAGGTWQLVKRPGNGAQVSTAGPDIRETVFVLRPGDSRCCPTGGTRSRIWHWNGARFVVGRWTQTESPAPVTVHLYSFFSPSHNISCSVGDEGRASCVSRNRPGSATLSYDGTVTICEGPPCARYSGPFSPGYAVLGYGQRDQQGRLRCTSEPKGITCILTGPGKGQGKGFLISRDGVTRVGH